MDVAQIKYLSFVEYVKETKRKKESEIYRLYTGKLKICSHLDYSLLNRIKTIECVMYMQLYYIYILYYLYYYILLYYIYISV